MVKIMENPIKMDDFGGPTPIFGNTHMLIFVLESNLTADGHVLSIDLFSWGIEESKTAKSTFPMIHRLWLYHTKG